MPAGARKWVAGRGGEGPRVARGEVPAGVAAGPGSVAERGCAGGGRECETGRSGGHGEREAEPRRDYLFCSATDASWMVLKMRLMKSISMP